MTEFKTGDRVRAVRDTSTLGGRPIKEGEQFVVLASPDGRAYMPVAPSSGAWPARGGFRPDSPTGGRSVSAEDFEHDNAPVVDDLWDAKDRVQREVAAEVFTAPAPLDPSGRLELAADFFHAKTGTAASYFTVDLSPEERAPYYAAADAFLAAHLTPEPEPEWKPGTVADIEADGDNTYRAIRTEAGWWEAENNWTYADAEVTDVRPLVVIDPDDVDVVALQREIDNAVPGHEASVALGHLGLTR
jgi:hypothetical protein